MPFPRFLAKAGLCLALISGSLAAGPVPAGKPSHYPAWWFEQDVIVRLPAVATKPNPVWPADYPSADDFTAVNVGQLKNMATQAAAGMNIHLSPYGAGAIINQKVAEWGHPSMAPRDDFSVVNIGQLKAVAILFHDRLGVAYPWSSSTSDDDNYAVANIGQLKRVFSFPLSFPLDVDFDGLIDTWEISKFGDVGIYAGSDDVDDDALSNRAESLIGSNPESAADSGTAATTYLGLTVYSP